MNQNNKHIRHAKVARGLFGAAVSLNLKKEVQFYYVLKNLNNTGYIKNQGINKFLKSQKIAKTQFYRWMKRLVELELVIDYGHGYRVVSYDKFFKRLGLGKEKVYKIKSFEKVLEHTFVEGIQTNLENQQKAIDIKIQNKKLIVQDIPKTATSLVKRDELIDTVEFLHVQGKSNTVTVNKDVTLSIKGLGRLFSMPIASVHRMLMKTKELGLIDVIKRETFVATWYDDFESFRKKYKSNKYQLRDGIIYYVLPSKLIPYVGVNL